MTLLCSVIFLSLQLLFTPSLVRAIISRRTRRANPNRSICWAHILLLSPHVLPIYHAATASPVAWGYLALPILANVAFWVCAYISRPSSPSKRPPPATAPAQVSTPQMLLLQYPASNDPWPYCIPWNSLSRNTYRPGAPSPLYGPVSPKTSGWIDGWDECNRWLHPKEEERGCYLEQANAGLEPACLEKIVQKQIVFSSRFMEGQMKLASAERTKRRVVDLG